MSNNIPEEIKQVLKQITPTYKQHGQYQMCLGGLIKALQRERTVSRPNNCSSVYCCM